MNTSGRIAGWAENALLVPRVAWLAARAPKDWRAGWERYWGNVHATGIGGDVLWDTGDLGEAATYVELARRHLDSSLPLVDVGCGNARFTRRLAPLFSETIGTDLSANAVARARAESASVPDLTFRTLDLTDPDAGRQLAAAIGRDANVFVRGVFHVLEPADRVTAARTLRAIVGTKGRVLLAETNFQGSKLDYLRHLGATPRYIPRPLQRAIADIPAPGHFGEAERRTSFPDTEWTVVDDGGTDILTIPLHHVANEAADAAGGAPGTDGPDPAAVEHIPGYYAVLEPAG